VHRSGDKADKQKLALELDELRGASQAAQEDLQRAVTKHEASARVANARVTTLEAELQEAIQHASQHAAAVESSKSLIASLRGAVQRAEATSAAASERADELEGELAPLATTTPSKRSGVDLALVRELQARIEAVEEEAARKVDPAVLEAFETRLDAATAESAQLHRALAAADTKVRETNVRADAAQRELNAAATAELRAQLDAAEAAVAEQRASTQRASEAIHNATARIETLEGELQAVSQAEASAQEQLRQANDTTTSLRASLQRSEQTVSAEAEQVRSLDAEIKFLRSVAPPVEPPQAPEAEVKEDGEEPSSTVPIVEQLACQLAEVRAVVAQRTGENSILQDQVVQLQHDLSRAETEVKKAVQELADARAQMREETQTSKAALQQSQAQLQQTTERIQVLEFALKEAEEVREVRCSPPRRSCLRKPSRGGSNMPRHCELRWSVVPPCNHLPCRRHLACLRASLICVHTSHA
jgi:chromosome segregation ATPase